MADTSTSIEYSAEVAALQNRIATALEAIATSLASLNVTTIPALATTVTDVKTVLATVKTSIDEEKSALLAVKANLEVDLTDRSILLVEKDQTGIAGAKSVAFLAASTLQNTLIGKAETTNTGSETETDPYANLSEAEKAALALATSNNIISAITDGIHVFLLFLLGSITDQRIYFQSTDSFLSNKKGLPFDFSRYMKNRNTLNNVEIMEYVILPYETTSKVSTQTGSSDFSRIKSWINELLLQTFVIFTNKVNGTSYLYFPAAGTFLTYDATAYKTKKYAIDGAVASYEKSSGTSYSYSIIPVASIPQDITREEYRDRAKLITPEYEYN